MGSQEGNPWPMPPVKLSSLVQSDLSQHLSFPLAWEPSSSALSSASELDRLQLLAGNAAMVQQMAAALAAVDVSKL